MPTLSLDQARRIALAAQGLDKGRPAGPVTSRTVGRTFARLQLVQIDSVNVLARSHFLPFFSRLGNYDRTILQRMSATHPRRMVEYWAHEASYIRPEHFADLRLWQKRSWVGAHSMDPALLATISGRILETLATARPLTAAQIADRIGHVEEKQNANWGWNWSAVKRVLEHLFEEGVVSAASRTEQFERRYTLTAKVLPNLPGREPGERDLEPALHRLIDAAAQAHGIGTVRCFADYFRTPVKAAAAAVNHLVDSGRLVPVTVAGWNREVFLHTEARLPRRATGRALLSPFDSLVFERRRLEEQRARRPADLHQLVRGEEAVLLVAHQDRRPHLELLAQRIEAQHRRLEQRVAAQQAQQRLRKMLAFIDAAESLRVGAPIRHYRKIAV